MESHLTGNTMFYILKAVKWFFLFSDCCSTPTCGGCGGLCFTHWCWCMLDRGLLKLCQGVAGACVFGGELGVLSFWTWPVFVSVRWSTLFSGASFYFNSKGKWSRVIMKITTQTHFLHCVSLPSYRRDRSEEFVACWCTLNPRESLYITWAPLSVPSLSLSLSSLLSVISFSESHSCVSIKTLTYLHDCPLICQDLGGGGSFDGRKKTMEVIK